MFEDYKKFLIKLATIFPWLSAKRLSIDPAVFSVFLTHLSLKSVSAGDPLLKLSKILFFFGTNLHAPFRLLRSRTMRFGFVFTTLFFFFSSLHFELLWK